MDPLEKAAPSLKELTALCREWQERLRLQDWRVRICYSKEYELDGNQAHVAAKIAFKAATILINPHCKEDCATDCVQPYEVRIIHELVHLHWEPVWPKCSRKSLAWEMAEAAVDSLAWALYRAKYGKKVKDTFVG